MHSLTTAPMSSSMPLSSLLSLVSQVEVLDL